LLRRKFLFFLAIASINIFVNAVININKLKIESFLTESSGLPLLDVRSPSEFLAGHIPTAINFPILNDENRKLVGICYKTKGHDEAVLLGYKLAGPHFNEIIKEAFILFPEKKVSLHCFRGGLRSKIMSYLLETAGFTINLLDGGYKSYRKFVLDILDKDLNIKVLGGYTGSGKTEILQNLGAHNSQIIDLEKLANHKGSAFGSLGLGSQPTQEQFENNLAAQILQLDNSKTIWVEDESRMIGCLVLPTKIYDKIRSSPLVFLDYTSVERSQKIITEYGCFPKDLLIESTKKIRKRLGDETLRLAIDFLAVDDYNNWVSIILNYYDKTYLFGLEKRTSATIEKTNLRDLELLSFLKSME